MRQEIVDYLQGQNLGTYLVSTELPWTDNGVPLYVKNLRKIYVNVDEFATNPIFQTLDGSTFSEEVTSVRVFFANDAKQQPPNYDEVVSIVKSARNLNTTVGYNRREVEVTADFDADRIITEIELRFIKLI